MPGKVINITNLSFWMCPTPPHINGLSSYLSRLKKFLSVIFIIERKSDLLFTYSSLIKAKPSLAPYYKTVHATFIKKELVKVWYESDWTFGDLELAGFLHYLFLVWFYIHGLAVWRSFLMILCCLIVSVSTKHNILFLNFISLI